MDSRRPLPPPFPHFPWDRTSLWSEIGHSNESDSHTSDLAKTHVSHVRFHYSHPLFPAFFSLCLRLDVSRSEIGHSISVEESSDLAKSDDSHVRFEIGSLKTSDLTKSGKKNWKRNGNNPWELCHGQTPVLLPLAIIPYCHSFSNPLLPFLFQSLIAIPFPIRGNSAMVQPLWRAAGCGDKASLSLSLSLRFPRPQASYGFSPPCMCLLRHMLWLLLQGGEDPYDASYQVAGYFPQKSHKLQGSFAEKAWLFGGNWSCIFRPKKEVLSRKMTCKVRPQKRATDCRALLRELTLQLHAKERGSFAGNGP